MDRTTTRLPLALLLLGALALAAAPNASAEDGIHKAVSQTLAPLSTTFRVAPRWEAIPGTRVSWVREADRPDYDLFRYGSKYYIYDHDTWYRSDGLNRRFTIVDDRAIPRAFGAVPGDRWRNYPPGWRNPRNPHYSGRHDNGRNPGMGDTHHEGNGKGKKGR